TCGPRWRTALSDSGRAVVVSGCGSVEVAEDALRHARGLRLALDLDGVLEDHLEAALHLGHGLDHRDEAIGSALLEGRGEAHLVEPVVEDGGKAGHLHRLEEEPGDAREGEVAV